MGCCEQGNDPSGSIKGGEFLDQLSVLLASEDGLFPHESSQLDITTINNPKT
jgi:hypothetical protein